MSVGRRSVLEVKDIVVRYGRRGVIHGLSLSVADGEVVTLVGSNGAGKTTTLKSISGLLRPVSGSIVFVGERIDTLQPVPYTHLQLPTKLIV